MRLLFTLLIALASTAAFADDRAIAADIEIVLALIEDDAVIASPGAVAFRRERRSS